MSGPRVKLSKIVETMDMAGDMHTSYFDRRTGEVVAVVEEQGFSEEGDAPEWERQAAAIAREIEEDEQGRFVELPDKFEIDEWRMMADFAASLSDGHVAASLSNTIRGSGAFRRFKDMAAALGVLDRWYEYRGGRCRELAKEWCEGEGIEWEDDGPK